MRRMAIIPMFIPHLGCPNDCVFCNQRAITARQEPVSPEDVRRRAEEYLPTLSERGLSRIEIAFFGGSFTGIPMEEQSACLAVAKEYKESGKIQGIRISTRPDYIDDEILTNLKEYGVDTIELGVQSFDDKVLRLANRGHDAACVYKSAEKIHEYGFELGIQLMIGLPGDTVERSVWSAGEAVSLKPAVARLYPTVILKDTRLYHDYQAGRFTPFTSEEMICAAKEMYKTFSAAGVAIIRVGLKSTDLICDSEESAAVPGTYHPAFRQLVCARIAREELEAQLGEILKTVREFQLQREDVKQLPESETERLRVLFFSSGTSFSNMIGNRGENRRYFQERYPKLEFRFCRDDSLPEETYKACPDFQAGSRQKNKQ